MKARRPSGHFKFDLPKQPRRKRRKGSASNYRIPSEEQQRMRDESYVAFQSPSPKLNEAGIKLRGNVSQCGTIFGGRKLWLRKETKMRNGTTKWTPFPIIVDGRRCPNQATSTVRRDGKNIHRCAEHRIEDAWIEDDPIKEGADA